MVHLDVSLTKIAIPVREVEPADLARKRSSLACVRIQLCAAQLGVPLPAQMRYGKDPSLRGAEYVQVGVIPDFASARDPIRALISRAKFDMRVGSLMKSRGTLASLSPPRVGSPW